MATANYVTIGKEHYAVNHPLARKHLGIKSGEVVCDPLDADSTHFEDKQGTKPHPQPSKRPITPISVWMPYQIKSLNVSRYKHWAVRRKESQEAKEAWVNALQSTSSHSALDSLIQIICRAGHVRRSGMPSPNPSESTMPTNSSSGTTTKSKPNPTEL